MWKMVGFIVSPGINGQTDLLAYLRKLYYYNCSYISYYHEFKADGTYKSWSEATCQSKKTIDEEADFTNWAIKGDKLVLSAQDGTRQEITYTFKQGAPDKVDTQMILQWRDSGSSYTVTFSEL